MCFRSCPGRSSPICLSDAVWLVELLSLSAPVVWTRAVWLTLRFQLTKPHFFPLTDSCQAAPAFHALQNSCCKVPRSICSTATTDNIDNLRLLKMCYFCLTGFSPKFVFGIILSLVSSLSLLFLPTKKEICIFSFYPYYVHVPAPRCLLASS